MMVLGREGAVPADKREALKAALTAIGRKMIAEGNASRKRLLKTPPKPLTDGR